MTRETNTNHETPSDNHRRISAHRDSHPHPREATGDGAAALPLNGALLARPAGNHPIAAEKIRALITAEERLHLQSAALASAANGIVITDCKGAILWVNPAFAAMTGYTPDELLGQNPRMLKSGRHDAAHFRQLWETILAGKIWHGEITNRRKSGEIYHGEQTITPVRDRSAAITHFIGVTNDITERKRMEEALRESEDRLAKIFRASPVAIGYATVAGRILDVNAMMCELTGYTRDEMVGHTAQELRLWSHPEEHTRTMEQLEAGNAVTNMEVRVRRKSGEIRIGLLSMENLDLPHEPLVLVTVADLTDRKLVEAQLLRAERLESLGRLASGVAHDLNNILAPIMMAPALLRSELPTADTESVLATIETSAQRGAALVRQLLLYGRGTEETHSLVRPADLINEVVAMLRASFPRSIDVRVATAQALWVLEGDTTQLHQVLLNLCLNARDAMPQGGAVTVSAENVEFDSTYTAMAPDAKPGRYVVMRVADAGSGIPPEIVDKIFDPFFTTKGADKGTGLGLSTVLGIVKRHRGFVRLQTETGRGTTFEVYLPAAAGTWETTNTATLGGMPLGNGELILIVDDEEPVRAILHETLTRRNYKVVSAPTGVEAVAIFCARPAEVKLVITDLDMPLMDGISLVRVLRRLQPSVRIVVSTGVGSSGAASRITEVDTLGISALLTKPYTAADVLRVVNESLAVG